MQLSVETKQEMQRVFEQCRETIRSYPAQNSETGIRYLDRFDPALGNGPTNYICCLLPYWLREAAQAPLEICREIAEANVFGMLHFHLQDERMDRISGSGLDRAHIVLSQLFNTEMNARYVGLFSSSAAFSSAVRRCTSEWASGLASEHASDPFFDCPQEIAARSAPLLLSPLALFSENERLLDRAVHAVRESLITLQMADDWADYAEDLREDSYNCLVSLYRREKGLSLEAQVNAAEIDNAVYAQGLLTKYAQYAAQRQIDLKTYAAEFSGLIEFHAALAGDLERIAAGIETEKHSLSLGGLNYWLLGQKNL